MSLITPISRWTEKVIEDDGTIAYKVYNKMSPHYYMDKTGSYHSIDITNVQTITKDTVGEIKLRKKNIVSAGLRTDGNKTKYLGLRPDNTQEDGIQQFEWTIEEAIINNTTQSITLNQTSSIDGITTNLGGQVVQSTRHFTRQMVPVTGSITNFQVKYKLHLTGLQISNSKADETDYYTEHNGQFKIKDSDNNVQFRITEPVLLDSDLNEILHISESITSGSQTFHTHISNPTTHTLKDNGDGTYEYTKYPSEDLLKTEITSSVRYIDATTVYGDEDLDGWVTKLNTTSWNSVHDATVGSLAGKTSTGASTAAWASITSFFGNIQYRIHRSFLGFDTSVIQHTPQSAKLYLYEHTNPGSFILVEATHTDIVTSTFNDFTGFESGWDGDNAGGSGAGSGIVPYTPTGQGSGVADGYGGVTTDAYYDIDLNDAAITAIANNDTWKTCAMTDNDFKDIGGGAAAGFYFTEYTGTSRDPYLYIVEAVALGNVHILSGKLILKGGKLTIK